MGRPVSEGFTYFSHDVDMSSDEKIELLEARHGLIGYAVYVKLLERIFRSGGFFDIVLPETLKVLANKFGITEDALNEIISTCVVFDLFDSELYDLKVLTSRGIVKRAKPLHDNRLKNRGEEEKIVLTETEKQFKKYYKILFKESSNNGHSKGKERKGKKSKGNEEKDAPVFEDFSAWTDQVLNGQDSFFESMLMKEHLELLVEAVKDHLSLLSRYPKMQPQTQQAFRYSLIKHMKEFKPQSNGQSQKNKVPGFDAPKK